MRRLVTVTVFLVYLTGCAQQTGSRLEPASGATSGDADTVGETVDGVTVRAEVDAWDGLPSVRDHVTPVRVTIENRSDRPVRVQYTDLALVAPTGHRFSALPPYRMEGDVLAPVLVGDRPIGDPGFAHRGFRVAPYYGDLYPTIEAYPHGFATDRLYHDAYHERWVERDLPTPSMLRALLPEGVIEPGGMVSGFVFFERVGDVSQVELVAELVDARRSDRFGQISLPFRVEG